KDGRGYFVLDVSQPCLSVELSAFRVPAGDYASNLPEVYTIPVADGTRTIRRGALIVTGGLDGTARIAADRLDGAGASGETFYTGSLIAAPNTSYPHAPICVDTSGDGFITYCYALRSDGLMARISVSRSGFGAPVDITPKDSGGRPITIATNRIFSTAPVA